MNFRKSNPLKLSYTDDGEDTLERRLKVESPGKGDWHNIHGDAVTKAESNGIFVFEGYGGENLLTVILSFMQDFSVDILVVHTMIDNPSKTAQKRVDESKLQETLDSLLEQLQV